MFAKNIIINNKYILPIFFIVNIATLNIAAAQSVAKKYPTPEKSDKLLFYIQRSLNLNTIAYELNFDKTGKLNSEYPVHPYWIRYEENAKIQELSYIQKKMAYGIDAELINNKNKTYNLKLVSFPSQIIVLKKLSEKSKIRAYTNVNGKFIELQKIFFKTENDNSFSPTVKYIDISGTEVKTSKYIIERIYPK